MSKSKWFSAWASVRGKAHEIENEPGQDFSQVSILQDSDTLVAVIADGAGSCENSHIGAEKVTEITLQLIKQRLIANQWVSKNEHPDALKWRNELFYIFKAVKAILRKFANESKLDFKSLSSTLCVVVSNGYWIGSAHVGDSRAAWRDTDGNWSALITPQKGEEVNSTQFLTSEDWESSVFSSWFETVVVQANVTAIAVLTDGCERASFEMSKYDDDLEKYYDPNKPHQPFFEPNYQALRQFQIKNYSQDAVNRMWATFLKEGTPVLKKETDDKTLVLGVYESDYSNSY